MMEEAQVRTITKKVLDEEHLLGLIKIFEKEHNLFRGSHDKIQLPAALNVPDRIINQIVEKFDTQLTEGSIPFIDEDQHFTEANDVFFYDEAKEILCLGLNSPETDMVGGYIMKEGTPPTQDIADCFQAYAMDTPLERLTDGGLEIWAGATDLTNWTEFNDGGAHEREASEVHGGTYSMKLTTNAGGDYCGFQQDFVLNPGYNCRVAVWYLRTAHAGSDLRLYVYDDGPNVYLQSDGTWDATGYITLAAVEVWTLYELEFVAHANYTNYTVKFYKGHSAGGAVSFYLDDISISENRNVVPYFRTEAGLVIGLNQDLRTSASVIYAGLTLTGFSGVLKAVDGVVTEAADHIDLANITSDQHHNQIHATTHHSGGGDAVQLDNLASPDDNTDLNATTSKHGLLLKLGGGTTNFLRADGTWAAPLDGKVKVDVAATADYIGAASNDGVLRSDAPLTYVDGGNFVTLGLDQTAIDHDVLANTHNLTTDIDHDALTNTHDLTSDIDHDAIANFEADEHLPALDEDNMVSDSDTNVATQQSIKAYVDGQAHLDEKVKVDVAATAGYLGVAFGDGVLRVTENELTVTDGGNFITLGLADHATARAALGLAIGSDVLAYDAGLSNLASVAMAADKFYYTSGDNTHIAGTITAAGRALIDDANAAAQRTTLGLVIGTDVLAEQTIGIADDNLLEVDDADAADNDYAKFTANGLEGRSYAEVLSDIGALANIVEDTTPQLGGDLDMNGKNIDFPSVANISDCKDEDNMASNSATMLATQQSIKAYVDASGNGGASTPSYNFMFLGY